MAANAARRALVRPLQRRLSPACNSDCARIWASSKVTVPLLCPVQGFLANRPHSMIELSRPILASSSRTKVVVDLSIEPPGRNPNCSAAVTSCYFSDHASSSGSRLWARSYVSRMSEMRTRASTGSCITSRWLTLDSGRALPTSDMWSRAQMCQSVTPQLRPSQTGN